MGRFDPPGTAEAPHAIDLGRAAARIGTLTGKYTFASSLELNPDWLQLLVNDVTISEGVISDIDVYRGVHVIPVLWKE
jgi:hypothetical protein